MKKKFFTILPSLLFILPNSISYVANITANQTGMVQNQLVNLPNKINDKELYDIGDGNPVTPYLRYGNHNDTYWIYQTSIRNSIFSYKKIQFEEMAEVWASWGNTPYKGEQYVFHNINEYLSETNPSNIENKKLKNIYDVNQNSFTWFHVKDKEGSAVVEIVVRFHITWFYNPESQEFYFQIGIYMAGETWASFSGGKVWADLGKKLIFYY